MGAGSFRRLHGPMAREKCRLCCRAPQEEAKRDDIDLLWLPGRRRRGAAGADARELLGERLAGDLGIVIDLQAQPPAFRQAEVAAQPQIGVGGDHALARDDLADAPLRHADLFRQPVLAHAERLEEVLQQDLARRHGWQLLAGLGHVREVHTVDVFDADGHGCAPSMVIDDFHVKGVAMLEAKAQAPLVVDADAPLALAAPTELLQAIARRDAQLGRFARRVQLRRAVAHIEPGKRRTRSPAYSAAVSLLANDRIINLY